MEIYSKNIDFAHFVLQHSEVVDDYSHLGARERILLAALKLFVEQGYFNTNIPDLSKESKCSVGSIYHHFRNKEEVATALHEAGLVSFRLALEKELQGCQGVEQVVRTLVKSFLTFSEQHHYLSKYVWLSRHVEFMSGAIRHPTRVGFDKLGRLLTRSIKTGIREKQIRDIPANELWSVLFGIPLSYVRDWLDGFNKHPPSSVAENLADCCWRALRV